MNDRDAKWHDLYSVDLGSGERTLVERNTQEFSGSVADAEYQVQLATRARPDGGQDVLKRDGQAGWEITDQIPFAAYLSTSYVGMTTNGTPADLRESPDRNTTALYGVDRRRTRL